jgi:hypothetical protein
MLQMNPDHAHLSHFFKIHFSIILPPLHLNLLGVLRCIVSPQTRSYAFVLFMRAIFPDHLIILDSIPLIMFS